MKVKELEYSEDIFDLFSGMVDIIEKDGFMKGIVINTEDINVSENIKDSCKYCTSYESNYSCPNYSPNERHIKELIGKYRHGLLLVLRIAAPEWLVEIPIAGGFFKKYLIFKNARKMHRMILGLQRLANENGFISDGFIAGKCLLHTKCKKSKNERCASPKQRRYSMESVGIDVFCLSKRYGIKLSNKLKDRFHYIGLLMAREKEMGKNKVYVMETGIEENTVNVPQDFADLDIDDIKCRLTKKYGKGTLIIAKNTENNFISLDKLIEVIRKSSPIADYGYVPVNVSGNFLNKIIFKLMKSSGHGVYVFIEENKCRPGMPILPI